MVRIDKKEESKDAQAHINEREIEYNILTLTQWYLLSPNYVPDLVFLRNAQPGSVLTTGQSRVRPIK
jgi:hypothetical protein